MQRNDVTIGIPVFNEERHIEAAIRSAANQCEALIVSDNASTDRSAEICKRLSREFEHMIFFSHAQNMGASANFRLVLEKAATSKFMWLGGHDMVPPEYVSRLDGSLKANPDAVLAYGAVQHIDADNQHTVRYDYSYSESLETGERVTRLLSLVRFLSDCSLIHGLFRTSALRGAWLDDMFLGVDHVLLSRAALLGRFVYVPETCLLRRSVRADDSKEDQLVRIVGHSMLGSATHGEMQRQQYALVLESTQGGGLLGFWRRFRARVILVNRFGPFSKGTALHFLDELIQVMLSARRFVRRRFT